MRNRSSDLSVNAVTRIKDSSRLSTSQTNNTVEEVKLSYINKYVNDEMAFRRSAVRTRSAPPNRNPLNAGFFVARGAR